MHTGREPDHLSPNLALCVTDWPAVGGGAVTPPTQTQQELEEETQTRKIKGQTSEPGTI